MMTNRDHKEIAICGFNAATAVMSVHPERVRRLFFTSAQGKRLGAFCRTLARERKLYKQTDDAEELERVAGTVHHGGVVVLADVPQPAFVFPEDVRAWSHDKEPLLLLDRIGNAHNLGALVRSAAFFGLRRVILAEGGGQAIPGGAAYRVAEGAMEHVECHTVSDLAGLCGSLRGFYRVVGTDAGDAAPLPSPGQISTWQEPVALVLGNEETGLSGPVRGACQDIFRIPGSGRVESLNVSAAGAVFMHALFHGNRR